MREDTPTELRQGQPGQPDASTVLGPRTGSARSSGAGDAPISALGTGTRLFEYEISRIVGQGGFGVVYAAMDNLGRTVAIKEYLPSSMAARLDSGEVTLRSQRHAEAFEAGLSSFINEARLLAQFDHPSLVKVFRFWEANGTAYMVMPLYRGLTLKQYLEQRGGEITPAWLHALLPPLLEALEVLHRARVYHRDIAPDNIMILEDGRPLLLDFGAARQRIGEFTQALTVIVKPGYAPIEQYAEDVSLRQGAWTDVYALCAVLYRVITGSVPPPSVSRLVNDNLRSLRALSPPGYAATFIDALDRGLSVRPEQRPQSIPELRALLAPAGDASRPAGANATGIPGGKQIRLAGALAAVAAAALLFAMWPRWYDGPAPEEPLAAPPAGPTASLEQPGTGEAPASSPGGPGDSGDVPGLQSAREPFDPARAMSEVVAGATPGMRVDFSMLQPQVIIEQDPVQFEVSSSRDGFLYLLLLDPQNQLYLIFPNGLDQDNRVRADMPMRLPRASWPLEATPPAGRNTLLAIVSQTKRDFSHTGRQPAGDFSEIARSAAVQRYAGHSQPWPFLAGRPTCPQPPCSSAYGAQVTSFEAVQGRH
jgi:hypothetical protein